MRYYLIAGVLSLTLTAAFAGDAKVIPRYDAPGRP
jgi:hypothetical protein